MQKQNPEDNPFDEARKLKFLSSMSHEIRISLNTILGFTDLLQGEFYGPLNEEQKEYVRCIDESGKHLLNLINDLLEKLKIDYENDIQSEIKRRERKILVAEDNENNVALILNMLSVYGHKVAVAKNGKEAIELASSYKPDLILMDIRMPVMDGFEATRRLRAMPEFASTPIIALTASVIAEIEGMCSQISFTRYFPKPIRTAELLSAIESCLKKESKRSGGS